MAKRNAKDYMQDGMFAELIESAEQALAYERGAREGYKVTQVGSPVPTRRVFVGEAAAPKSELRAYRKHKNVVDRK